jgi:Protein of unknown function (DUF3017)
VDTLGAPSTRGRKLRGVTRAAEGVFGRTYETGRTDSRDHPGGPREVDAAGPVRVLGARDEPRRDEPRRGGRRRAARPASAPRREPVLTVILVGFAACMAWLSLGHWRQGLIAMGLVALAAAVARLVIPTRKVGLLAVRGRFFDVVMLIGLAVAIVGLTLAVPAPHA